MSPQPSVVLTPNESHLPSPSPTHTKRKRPPTSASASDYCQNEKRYRPTPTNQPSLLFNSHNSRLAHWAEKHTWPANDMDDDSSVSLPAKKRRGSRSQSASTQLADRIRELAQHRIYADERHLTSTARAVCDALFAERFTEPLLTLFPPDRLRHASSLCQYRNERRIARDITSAVVPSPELLGLHDVGGLDHLVEELDGIWTRCSTMGWTCPKPDLMVGLKPTAFHIDEQQYLKRHATPDCPYHFTSDVCFPFLLCEAKPAHTGLDEAGGQNLHSAAIAVRAVFQLYGRAWGWKSARMLEDLDGQVLVFSISHDAHRVELYAHFAVCDNAEDVTQLGYYRQLLRSLNLKIDDGNEQLVSYNFVRNVYDQFAPQHLSRLRRAVQQLLSTRSSSVCLSQADGNDDVPDAMSDVGSDDMASEGSRGRKQARQEPSSVAMATMKMQLSQLMKQPAQQKQESAQMQQHMERQIAQQREDSAKQLAQQREDSDKQLAQQREDSDKQLAQQKENNDKQLSRMDRIVELLQSSQKTG